jgi:DNA uptake protein ComE-like DNA-binding protein
MLAGAVALFLLGLGWRVSHASSKLPPLQIEGQALEWSSELPQASVGDLEPHRSASTGTSSTPSPALVGPIHPNTATKAQLEALPGVGPALAQRILDARAVSPLSTLADLDRVKGIGPAKLEKLRPHLTF